ncbi:WD40 repeat-like protein [Suillus weaverae]|nr:WD40 repeat-like protein [Suillus weaverae]
MSSQTSQRRETPAIMPRRTMRGHTSWVKGVVHLPDRRRIITSSLDGSLRLRDLDGGAQIGEDWRDGEEKKAGVRSIVLSPNGKTVVSGSDDGKVKLWDVETGKVVAKWTGHTESVWSVCWSADGNRVGSGSRDGRARVWNVKTGKTIMEIKTGHESVWAVIYSPDNTQIATGGDNEYAAKIWDAKTGKLLATLKHGMIVESLAWTSDGEKLISGSSGPIRIFDTATWQEIAILKGHTDYVRAISLSQNNRLLASASGDKTARLWNLDTNLPVGSPLQHKSGVYSAALSADGKVQVTGCGDNNAYAWDIHATLKKAGLEDLLPTGTEIASKGRLEQEASQAESGIERTPRSSLSDKSFLEADATRCHNEFGGVDVFSPQFFHGMETNDHDSSPTGDAHPHFSASAFLARFASLLRRFRPNNNDVNELPQPPMLSGLHPHVLFARLSSLIHRSPPENDVPNELQQPSTPSRFDSHALFVLLSSLLPRSRRITDGEIDPRPTTPSGSRPDALMDLLSSFFRSQPYTNEEIELSQRATRLHVVEVAPMRDREVIWVAERPQPHLSHYQSAGAGTPGARPAHSRPIRLLGHIGLFLCCVCNHQHPDGNARPTQQQQGQVHTHVIPQTQQQQQCHSHGQAQVQASSSQTQPAAPSTSAIPTAPNYTSTPGAART